MANSMGCMKTFYRGYMVEFGVKLSAEMAQNFRAVAKKDGEDISHPFVFTLLGGDIYAATIDTSVKDANNRYVMSLGVYKVQAVIGGVTPTLVNLQGFKLDEPL